MKWVLSHASDDIHHWQLQKEVGFEFLSFNSQWLSLRLTGSSKRLLFLRVQGFLQKKVLLQTEYGVQLGETALTDKLSSGQLLLNEQAFFYEIGDYQLVLFNGEKQVLASCYLPEETVIEKLELYALLFGFAWFMTANAAVESKELATVTT
jgi:hypothetical protein